MIRWSCPEATPSTGWLRLRVQRVARHRVGSAFTGGVSNALFLRTHEPARANSSDYFAASIPHDGLELVFRPLGRVRQLDARFSRQRAAPLLQVVDPQRHQDRASA